MNRNKISPEAQDRTNQSSLKFFKEFCQKNQIQNFSVKSKTLQNSKVTIYRDRAVIKTCCKKYLYQNYSASNSELILDPFAGSGSLAITCIQRNKKYVGVEIDTKWFDFACRRIGTEGRNINLFTSNL